MIYDNRDEDLQLLDNNFLKLCKVTFFKSTGCGGQKKNKTSNAVRLMHLPTKLTSQASESRQQSVNRLRALRRLRLHLAEKIRLPQKQWQEQWQLNEKNPHFPYFIATILDILNFYNWSISDAANYCELSTNQFSKICLRHKNLQTIINQQRQKINLPVIK